MQESFDTIINIRRAVFEEVSRIAYEEADVSALEEAPYKIIPGEVARYREDVFRERAVVEERLRLAMGMDVRSMGEYRRVTDGFEAIDVDHNVYTSPLINIIKFACEACPPKQHFVTNNCRKCLARPCLNVCPKKAVHMGKNQAEIDPEACINCGLCLRICPFQAIIVFDRPCAAACGVDAIGNDAYGRAEIDEEKCVSCGRCVTQCPFGAIGDKSQIFQLVKALKDQDRRVYAMVAPSFVGQFGAKVSPEQVFEGLRQLGFKDVVEVGLGADITTLHEAKEFLERVPAEIPLMGTSCCYSWSLLVEKYAPEFSASISDSASPMRYTAAYIQERDPDAVLCFIGPCTSKKTEAIDTKVKYLIEFVITFEELSAMFSSRKIDLEGLEVDQAVNESSASARGYAMAGGVAQAVKEAAATLAPDRDVPIVAANSLSECLTLLKEAQQGKHQGHLLEGMACPGGCIAGMGTLQPLPKAKRSVRKFMKDAEIPSPFDNNLLLDSE